MKEEILRDKLQNLSVEQLGWINEYCDNNMSKLKKISYNAFFRYGIPEHEHDELRHRLVQVLYLIQADLQLKIQHKLILRQIGKEGGKI